MHKILCLIGKHKYEYWYMININLGPDAFVTCFRATCLRCDKSLTKDVAIIEHNDDDAKYIFFNDVDRWVR